MKIHEVIALLQRYPGDYEVQIPCIDEEGMYVNVNGISRIPDEDTVFLTHDGDH